MIPSTIFLPHKLKGKLFIRYSVSNLARKSTSSSFGSCVHGVGFFTKFFQDLIVCLELLEYFDLLLSVYNSDIF